MTRSELEFPMRSALWPVSDDELRKKWALLFPPSRDPRIKKQYWSFRTEDVPEEPQSRQRGETWVGGNDESDSAINRALWLRRPILVKGVPGIGKSSLAYSIAHHLDLGSVLRWEINSRSRLQDGLYEYRAVEHLGASQTSKKDDVAIESYIELGPLGTALVGGAKDSNKDKHRPRVLLIDEIDKSDYDLSNDLLHVLEESEFAISELRSKSSDDKSTVYAEDVGKIEIKGNKVVSHCHPIVIMTSNNEREFPAPFLRRCVEVELPNPDPQQLQKIIANHFKGSLLSEEVSSLPNSDDMSQNPAEALQEAYLAAVDGIDGIELKDLQSRNAANQNDNNSDEN